MIGAFAVLLALQACGPYGVYFREDLVRRLLRKIVLKVLNSNLAGRFFAWLYQSSWAPSYIRRNRYANTAYNSPLFLNLFVFGFLKDLTGEDQKKELTEFLPKLSEKRYGYFARLLIKLDEDLKVNLATFYSEDELNEFFSKNIFYLLRRVKRLRKEGDITESLSLIKSSPFSRAVPSNFEMIQGQFNVLSRGLDAVSARAVSPGRGENSVAYLLHNTLPYNSGGYATRSHGLAKGVIQEGIDITPVSRLGYPEDRSIKREIISDEESVDGVTYFRLNTLQGYGKIPLDQYLTDYTNAVIDRFQDSPPKVLHGASNYLNGVAAVLAAEKLGVKSVYEVRGLWELTRISREPEWESTENYKLLYDMEASVAKRADHVLAITNALKCEMIDRGVDEAKITVVPNGVNVERFAKAECPTDALVERYSLQGKCVLSFIGSFAKYEGLPLLVDAMEKIVAKRRDVVLLLVGDGEVFNQVKAMVYEKGLSKSIIITGRVPHECVEEYYAITDIAVYPRYPVPVAEKVSPIKPFESMASGKTVLVSNVEAMAEFIESGINGFTFQKGDIKDMVRQIEYLVDSPELRKSIESTAPAWVAEHRDWSVVTKNLVSVYQNLGVEADLGTENSCSMTQE